MFSIGLRHSPFHVNIIGINLTDTAKMLGTKIDTNPGWCAYDVCKRLSSVVFGLRILSQTCRMEVLKSVYLHALSGL